MNAPRTLIVSTLLAALSCTTQEAWVSSGAPNELEKTGEATSALRVCASGPTVPGIDVSEYQGVIDWGAVRGAGIQYAVARINDGAHMDPQFARNWQQMQAVGLIRGAYQFFRPSQSTAWQAQVVIDAVGRLGPNDLPVMMDVEWSSGSPTVAMLQDWLDRVEAGTGKRPLIYTAVGYWNQFFNGQFGSYPLWVANYGVSCPNLPNSWGSWTFWQWSSTQHVAGIGPNVDMDQFNGTLAQLQQLAGGGSVGANGCTAVQTNNCGAYGCACADGQCSGGHCPGNGCSATQTHNCAAYGCGCVDGECSGGACGGSGCTALQAQNCGAYGCGCADGQCSGGACAGSGCTATQTHNCSAYGCGCVDGQCSGGACGGSGCTALATQSCAAYGCGCADAKCSGGACGGSGCTTTQTSNCAAYGCGCSQGQCKGGACPN